MENQKLVTMITEEEIKSAITNAAQKYAKLYENQQLTIVADLRNSFIFIADLIRELPIDVTIQFVATPTHDVENCNLHESKIDLGLTSSLKDKNVLIVNDILLNGKTLTRLYDYVKEEEPSSIRILNLLEKENKDRIIDLEFESLFKIENLFIVGYGLTYNESYRGLKAIYSLEINE
ncbi:phosphoribosyltransferase [Spiroplasma turonicum]|uniref:Hypoxanthine-guanine phosphoribosyltransferase n=1 Tax=Spiroplasma turonicum TaxID=216946 RepID=A0A0K1P7M1_9MOLU|nr:phosphoribosyltransferase family protein [Spiroplasma turonicum]AKU80311.1 hypoxanthine-guanine phosphoribosyltransferase [Spiroplasma turonicum]ALX71312.1 hypoxanthine-guanine phosphoribosyltransferase [Spiroplasma turonicum]